jgi:aryl-alcohol dehydrogenase-like predicted oxidoreductase
MGMSFGCAPAMDKQEGIALIRTAVERGVNSFDTAEVNVPFTNDGLVGEALAPVSRAESDRDKARVQGRSERRAQVDGSGSRPGHINEAVEGSLKRLKIEAVHLL